MFVNVPLRLEPIALTLVIVTIEIPAAIELYSIAVVPDSPFRNARNLDIWPLHGRIYRRNDTVTLFMRAFRRDQ